MKYKLKHIIIAIMLITAPFLTFAQSPPHPNGGGGPTGGNTPVGGPAGPAGAPVGNGVYILLAMGMAYGALKLFQARRIVTAE